jgi:hypothetical protein
MLAYKATATALRARTCLFHDVAYAIASSVANRAIKYDSEVHVNAPR